MAEPLFSFPFFPSARKIFPTDVSGSGSVCGLCFLLAKGFFSGLTSFPLLPRHDRGPLFFPLGCHLLDEGFSKVFPPWTRMACFSLLSCRRGCPSFPTIRLPLFFCPQSLPSFFFSFVDLYIGLFQFRLSRRLVFSAVRLM